MAFELGQSFSPTDQAQQNQQQNGQLTPVQQAIKILSLRVPQQGGASGITPNALLTAPGGLALGGGAGGPGGVDIMELLRRLLQPGAGGPGAGPAPTGISGAPLPNVVPGSLGGINPVPPQPLPPSGGGGQVTQGPTQPYQPVPGQGVVDRTTPPPFTAPSPFGGGGGGQVLPRGY